MGELPEQNERSAMTEDVDADVHKVFREGAPQVPEGASDAIEETAQRLRAVEGLREENWQKLDEAGRRAVLNAAGREVSDVLRQPAPPLHIEDMHDPSLRGTYGDGFRSGVDGEIEGSDYRISMNSEGLDPGEGVLGDDPRQALETYLHEFRHGYQHEQIARFDKPQFQNLVDNHELAEEWSRNVKEGYQRPEVDYESYHNQPLETDARDFASRITGRLFPEPDDSGER